MHEVPPPLLNEKAAAEWLGMSLRWIQGSRVTGDGPPFVRIGRSVRYRPRDLEEWASEHIYHSTAA